MDLFASGTRSSCRRCTGSGHHSSPSPARWAPSSDIRFRSTPTSRRNSRRGSRPTTTSMTSSCSRLRARNAGSYTSRFTRTRSARSRGRSTQRLSPSRAAEPAARRPHPRSGDVLYLPRGFIHSAEALGGVSVHLTIGVHAHTRNDLVRSLLELAADDATSSSFAAAGGGRRRPRRPRPRPHRHSRRSRRTDRFDSRRRRRGGNGAAFAWEQSTAADQTARAGSRARSAELGDAYLTPGAAAGDDQGGCGWHDRRARKGTTVVSGHGECCPDDIVRLWMPPSGLPTSPGSPSRSASTSCDV